MRKIIVLAVLLCTFNIAPAQAASGSSIYVSLPGEIWRFDAAASTGTKLGAYQTDLTAPTIKVSPDGKWMAASTDSALDFGQMGHPLSRVSSATILPFGFSPDSRYFTYTLYADEAWTFGIIDLQAGKKTEFTDHAVTIPPDIDVTAPFGKMIPTVA